MTRKIINNKNKMSLKTTFIARASDGLILCESYDSVTDSQTEKLK